MVTYINVRVIQRWWRRTVDDRKPSILKGEHISIYMGEQTRLIGIQVVLGPQNQGRNTGYQFSGTLLVSAGVTCVSSRCAPYHKLWYGFQDRILSSAVYATDRTRNGTCGIVDNRFQSLKIFDGGGQNGRRIEREGQKHSIYQDSQTRESQGHGG